MAESPDKAKLPQGLFAWMRVLSIDVVLGSVAGGASAQVLFQTSLPHVWLLVLALSVWSVYSLDHLLDARKMGSAAHSARHYVHFVYFKQILGAVFGATILTLVLVAIALDAKTWWFGGAMGLLTGLHLLLVRWVGAAVRPWLLKELGVGLIYTLGIWGLPMFSSGIWNSWTSWILPTQFFLVGMMNLLVFSIYERDTDAQDGQTSLVQAFGVAASKRIAWALGAALVVLAALWIHFQGDRAWMLQASVCIMGAVQLVIVAMPSVFVKHERYRSVGDAVFSLPWVYVLAAGLK
jgi:hypothetical protein